jgi:long-subunit acyl-CoA synthetase (AMP-forming)
MTMNSIEQPVADRAMGAATLCEAFQITAASCPHRVALRTPGDAFVLTWKQYAERVRRTAAGLAALGVRRGDTVALMLTNRPEFHWVDLAVMHLGATSFGVYNTFAQEQVEHVLRDAECAVAITEQAFADTLGQASRACPRLRHIVLVDGGENMLSLDEVDAGGDPGFDLASTWPAVQPNDVVTLIYTSGTSGPPKGVQHTHASVIANARALAQAIPGYRPGFSAVSYLPLAHIMARVFEHYGCLLLGATLTCCAGLDSLGASLLDARPTWFVGVPRVWEKLKAALLASLRADPDEQRRQAIQQAISKLGLVHTQQAGGQPSAQSPAGQHLLDAQVLGDLRSRVGLDRVEAAMIAAAPVPPGLIEFFHALGIPLCEAYGMSEMYAATTNRIDAIRIGTVGQPLPGLELRLADDGEILMRGPTMMLGYRNLPDKTAETIDPDGWLHSGDIGALDEDGYLRIIDRKKEMIINCAGHNMSPANIEARLKASSPLIGQAVCIGDARPYNVALLVLDPDAAAAFAQAHRLSDTSLSTLCADRRVLEEIAAGVAHANTQLSLPEQIRRWTLLDCHWPPGGEELTPTIKPKRDCITAKYAAIIEDLYQDHMVEKSFSSRPAAR